MIVAVDPADIDNPSVGMRTGVRFPGLRESSPPIIRGRVARLSADSFTDEETGRSHFRTECVVPSQELNRLGPSARSLRAGMQAKVVILTRKRTAPTYLFEPMLAALWSSGKEQ